MLYSKNPAFIISLFICMILSVKSNLNAQVPEWAWVKSAGGVSDDFVSKISVDPFGNSFIVGNFLEKITLGTNTLLSAGGFDIFVAKYDANGNVLWAKRFGGADNDYGNNIGLDPIGNVFLTGNYKNSILFENYELISNGGSDVYVAKLDSNGNVLWAISTGGTNNDYSYSIALDATGNSHITGSFNGTALFGSTTLSCLGCNGDEDVFFSKIDSNGNVLWVKSVGCPNDDYSYSIAVDIANNIYVFGNFSGTATFGSNTLSSAGSWDNFLIKYDANGNLIWAKSLGGNNYDDGARVAIDINGNIYILGRFMDTTVFDNVILTSSGGWNIFIAKLDSNGNVIWAKNSDHNNSITAYGFSIDAIGNTYLSGYFNNSINLGVYNLTSAGGSDIFVAKYDSNGNVLWAKSAGGSGNEYCRSLGLDALNNIYVTGIYYDSSIIGSNFLANSGICDVFISKLDNNYINTNIAIKQNLNNKINISFISDTGILSVHGNNILLIQVFDITGKQVLLQEVKNEIVKYINLQKVNKGIFFVCVKTIDGVIVKKVFL